MDLGAVQDVTMNDNAQAAVERAGTSANWARKPSRIATALSGAQLGGWAVRILALVAGVLVWHWATAARLHAYIRFDHVPSPESVALAFAHNLAARDFYVHILVSLRRILVGYALASPSGLRSASSSGVCASRVRS